MLTIEIQIYESLLELLKWTFIDWTVYDLSLKTQLTLSWWCNV